ncbi:MAG TPA: hypothetical protein VK125_05465 [Bacillota bacterium]|nr:hypothetical protein [Bacillota bacterium]
MQRQLKASLFYLSSEIRYTAIIFWAIILSILAFSLVLDIAFFKNSDGQMMFNFSFPLYIFSAIVAQQTVKGSIPYLIKMGSTRKNIFASFSIYFFVISLVNAFIANTVHSLIVNFYPNSQSVVTLGSVSNTKSGESLSFNHLAFFLEDTWMTRMVVDTTIMFFLMAFAFVLGLFFYRFGLLGGFSFIGIIVLFFIIGMAQGWLLDFFVYVFSDITLLVFIQLFFVGLIIYFASYVLLRRLTIQG